MLKKIDRKAKRKILIAIVCSVLILFLFSIAASHKELAYISSKNEICFTTKLLDKNMLAIWNEKQPWKVNILDISKNDWKIEDVLMTSDKNYLMVRTATAIELYNLDGKVSEYKLDLGILGEKVINETISDINNDGLDELLIISGEADSQYGRRLRIYEFDNDFREVFEQDFGDMNPWKVQVCDVDGDGQGEISIAMYKTTVFNSVMAKRPYIYSWQNGTTAPKWRGSRLSRPFDDYIFTDIDRDGADEIIAIEMLEDGRKVVNSYKWKGFGFEGFAESESFEEIYSIQHQNSDSDRVIAKVRDGSSQKWVVFEYNDGKLSVKSTMDKYIPEI
jgi:hypothetical protein